MGFFKKLLRLETSSPRPFHPKPRRQRPTSLFGQLRRLIFPHLDDGRVDEAVASFERGRANWQLGRFHEAVQDLLRAAQSNPEDPMWLFHIYYFLGDSYRQIGRHDLAIFNLGIALGFRADPNAYLSRGWAHQAMNDQTRAMADFTEAIRLDPTIKARLPDDKGKS
jgi:tetratricopeptide (TPR) repeat protein